MKKIVLLFAILCVSILFVSASTLADFTIRSVSKEKTMVSIDIGDSANVKAGNDVVASWRDQECNLKITQINGNTAIADGRECEIFDKLQKGDKVALSEFQSGGKFMETAPVTNPEVGRKKTSWETEDDVHGFAVEVAYNLANNLTNNALVGTTYNSSGSLAIGARYASLAQLGWGFLVDVNYELQRSFGSSSNLGFTTTYATPPTLSFITIAPSAVYRQDKLYGFAGVNVPLVTSQANWGASSPSGAIGLQLGAGYFITKQVHAELNYSFKNFSFSGVNAALYGFGLQMGYYF